MAARVAGVLTGLSVGAAVEGNNPCVVDHLVQDDDVPGYLQNLHVVVIGSRHHRWSRVEAHQAPVGQASVGVAVGKPIP